MHYKNLGKSDLKISELSLGGMSFPNDVSEITSIIDQSIEQGINYIDTADLYQKGMNEELIGKAIKEYRKKIIVATKVGNQFSLYKEGWEWSPSKKHILNAVEDSLKRLQTDYIDLYQLHGGTLEDPFDEIVEAFEILQSQGKIRHYGISSIRPNVIRKYVYESNIVSVMMQYSLLDRRPETSILPLLKDKNIGVLARGVLAKGLLINKEPAQYLNYLAADVYKVQEYIKNISKENLSQTSIALQYVLSNDAISSAVVGVKNLKQINDILTYKKSLKLNAKQLQELSSILPIHIYTEHT